MQPAVDVRWGMQKPSPTPNAGVVPTQRGSQATKTLPDHGRNVTQRAMRVMIVDPDQGARESFQQQFGGLGAGTVIAARNGAEALDRIADTEPGDLAVVSVRLGADLGEVIRHLRAAGWQRVLAASPTGDVEPVLGALTAGATGVVVTRRGRPVSDHVPTGIYDLSAREVEVIDMVADGRSNKWIGQQLDLSSLTVKSHLARIGRKLGTGDRAHIVALALRAGVIN